MESISREIPAPVPSPLEMLNVHGDNQASVAPSVQHNKSTVPSTCVPCRSRHLKCDGRDPCTRCSSNKLDCGYVRSRRGYAGPKGKGGHSTASPVSRCSQRPICSLPPGNQPSTLGCSASSGDAILLGPRPQALPASPALNDLSTINIDQDLLTFDPKPQSLAVDYGDRCMEAFFSHFHAAHPFVLPKANLLTLLKAKPMDHLEAAMRYAGSFYVPQAPTTVLCLEAENFIYRMGCPRDGYKVQAMLLLAIGLDGYGNQEKALQILIEAQDLALELGMHRREFTLVNGGGLGVLEESWRRTWWELYTVDGMIAGVHQKSTFRMNDVAADVALPCEEREFVYGRIPPSRFIEDFDDESLTGAEINFSSYAYRIAAIRNLGRVLSLQQINFLDDSIMDRIDAHLVNWKLHLPYSKKSLFDNEGKLDEMLFQGHMVTEVATILLHRTHSQLDSTPTKPITSCAPHHPAPPGQNYNLHASLTVSSALSITKLITIPTPLTKHTHFFTCAITLAAIVHLICWSALLPSSQDEDLKQQVALNTGALKTLWEVWPCAGRAWEQVRAVAREIFKARKAAAEVGFWSNFTDEGEAMGSRVEDESMMDGCQLTSLVWGQAFGGIQDVGLRAGNTD